MPKACGPCRGSGQTLIEFRTRRASYWKDCAVCDGLGVVDVPWLRTEGIDHIIVSSCSGGWNHTACEVWGPGGEKNFDPKRRCRACVAQLKNGRPWKDGPRGVPTSEQIGVADA